MAVDPLLLDLVQSLHIAFSWNPADWIQDMIQGMINSVLFLIRLFFQLIFTLLLFILMDLLFNSPSIREPLVTSGDDAPYYSPEVGSLVAEINQAVLALGLSFITIMAMISLLMFGTALVAKWKTLGIENLKRLFIITFFAWLAPVIFQLIIEINHVFTNSIYSKDAMMDDIGAQILDAGVGLAQAVSPAAATAMSQFGVGAMGNEFALIFGYATACVVVFILMFELAVRYGVLIFMGAISPLLAIMWSFHATSGIAKKGIQLFVAAAFFQFFAALGMRITMGVLAGFNNTPIPDWALIAGTVSVTAYIPKLLTTDLSQMTGAMKTGGALGAVAIAAPIAAGASGALASSAATSAGKAGALAKQAGAAQKAGHSGRAAQLMRRSERQARISGSLERRSITAGRYSRGARAQLRQTAERAAGLGGAHAGPYDNPLEQGQRSDQMAAGASGNAGSGSPFEPGPSNGAAGNGRRPNGSRGNDGAGNGGSPRPTSAGTSSAASVTAGLAKLGNDAQNGAGAHDGVAARNVARATGLDIKEQADGSFQAVGAPSPWRHAFTGRQRSANVFANSPHLRQAFMQAYTSDENIEKAMQESQILARHSATMRQQSDTVSAAAWGTGQSLPQVAQTFQGLAARDTIARKAADKPLSTVQAITNAGDDVAESVSAGLTASADLAAPHFNRAIERVQAKSDLPSAQRQHAIAAIQTVAAANLAGHGLKARVDSDSQQLVDVQEDHAVTALTAPEQRQRIATAWQKMEALDPGIPTESRLEVQQSQVQTVQQLGARTLGSMAFAHDGGLADVAASAQESGEISGSASALASSVQLQVQMGEMNEAIQRAPGIPDQARKAGLAGMDRSQLRKHMPVIYAHMQAERMEHGLDLAEVAMPHLGYKPGPQGPVDLGALPEPTASPDIAREVDQVLRGVKEQAASVQGLGTTGPAPSSNGREAAPEPDGAPPQHPAAPEPPPRRLDL